MRSSCVAFLVLVATLGAQPAEGRGLCGLLLSALGQKVQVWDHSDKTFTQAKEVWTKELDGLSPAKQGAVIFRRLQAEGGSHPNHLMALLDVLNPSQRGKFSEWIRDLESLGYTLQFRNYRFSDRLGISFSRGLHWTERSVSGSRSTRHAFPFFWKVSGRVLTVRFPNTPPKTPEEAVDRIVGLTKVLAAQRLALVAQHAPLRSHPLPNGEYSFPKDALAAMNAAEGSIYTALKSLEQVFPNVGGRLPKRDGVWKWKNTQLILNALVTPFYPWYRPDKRMRPNQETYGRFLEDIGQGETAVPLQQNTFPKMNDWARTKYQSRFQLKWFSDRYVTAMKGLFVASLGWIAFKMAWGLYENEFEELDVPVPVGGEGSIEDLDQQTLENLIAYYRQSVEALVRVRDSSGDPEGKIQAEIDALTLEIDRLQARLN